MNNLRCFILSAVLLGTMTTASAQHLLWPTSIERKSEKQSEAILKRQNLKEEKRKDNASETEAWYNELTKKQKALFFPKRYAREQAERLGKMCSARNKQMQAGPVRTTEEDEYDFIGFNSSLPGVEEFNVSPFSSNTLTINSSITEYAFYYDNKYYSFIPVYNSQTKKIENMDCVTFSTNDWEVTDSVRIKVNGQEEVPYITAFDNTSGLFYSITMESDLDNYATSGDYYYLNVLDLETFKLTRIGEICRWMMADANKQHSIQGLVIINGKIYAINNYNQLVKIDKTTAELETVGKMKIGYASSVKPDYDQIVGLQGMAYEEEKNSILISHLDWLEGPVMYRAYINDITDGVVTTERLDELDNSYLYMYSVPEAEEQNKLLRPEDFTVTAGTDMKATISFTAPSELANGQSLTGNGSIIVKCTVDGEEMSLGEASTSGVKAGEKVNYSTTLPQGLHTVTVSLQAKNFDTSMGEIGNSDATSKIVYSGYDAPQAPLSPSLSIENNVATIKWSAPTEGMNPQWGATFDTSDITYTVIRTYDNKTVASGITETTCTDSNITEELHTYTYKIKAESHGQFSPEAETNSIVNGEYAPLPYTNDFSEEGCLDFMKIYNLNNDGTGRTWIWNHYFYNVMTQGAQTSYSNNFYLYTPEFKFDTEHVYLCQFNFRPNGNLSSSTVRLNAFVTKDLEERNNVDVIYEYNGQPGKSRIVNSYFRVQESDRYYIAFWDYSPEHESDGGSAVLDDIYIAEALSVNAPDSIKGIELTKAAEGALKATMKFIAPSKTIKGETLGNISYIKIFRDDELLATIDNPQPGKEVTAEVDAINDYNTFKISAYNDFGEGWPIFISEFIGPDVPSPVNNLRTVWGQDENDVEITWEKPIIGANGGYINPEEITYNIYKYDEEEYIWTLLQSGIKTTNFTCIEDVTDSQGYFLYNITACNEVGESNGASGDIFLGKSYTLPFYEPFSGSSLRTGPWLSDTEKGGLYWNLDNGYYDLTIDPVNQDTLKLMLMSESDKTGASRMTTPIINLKGYEHPAMTVYLYHERSSANSFCRIDASTNGMDFEPVSENISMNDNSGWVKHVIPLDKVKDQRVILALYGELDKPSSRLFADEFSVIDLSDTDLALSAISYDRLETMNGKNAVVTVTVANHGAEPASDYIVEFYANNKNIGEVMPEETLASGEYKQFEFVVPVNAGNDTIKCYAQVVADKDIRQKCRT